MSDQNIENKHLPVNDENDFDEISLDDSDETIHYTIVPNNLIREESLSPLARWLIIYFLSMKAGWKIRTRQLYGHLKGFIGRDKIQKIIKECIEAGYMKREVIKKSSGNGKILHGYKYTVSSTPKFKKCLRQPENQVTGNRETDSRETDHQEPDGKATKELPYESLPSSNTPLLKVPKGTEERGEKSSPVEDFSFQALETSQLIVDSMRIIKPDYAAANGKWLGILLEVDRMIRLDKRDPQKIIDVFRWALADNFWADKMFKPNPAKYLRDKFDQLEMKMLAKPDEPRKVDRRTRDKDGNVVNPDEYKGLF